MIAMLLVPVLIGSQQSLQAVSARDWQAGRIIDDAVFTNTNAISVQEIQNILNQAVPVCDTWGEKRAPSWAWGTPDYNSDGVISRWEYGKYKGNPVPFTCLKNYYENPTTKKNNYGGKPIPEGARSAARLIYDAGQKYNINPQVLLVILRKESTVFSDDWPFLSQFQYAMGAGCPDGPNGANCDPAYAGFSTQIDYAAELLRSYLNNMDEPWWSYRKPYQTQDIMWNTRYDYYTHPQLGTISCNSDQDQYDNSVYIENKATAALYTYTPYQPNQASLNVYPAAVTSGSSFDINCASYGNRNFWFIFSNWFGTTYNRSAYHATYAGQAAYPSIKPGESASVYITYQNTGTKPWYDEYAVTHDIAPDGTNPVVLATNDPLNRISKFNADFANKTHPTRTFATVYKSDGTAYSSNPHVVQPGESARFAFTLTAPEELAAGTYREVFTPLLAGANSQVFNRLGTYLDVTVLPSYTASYRGQSAYPTIAPGGQATAYFRFENTGNVTWYDDYAIANGLAPAGAHPTRLATAQPVNRFSDFGSGWDSVDQNRAAHEFAAVYESDGVTLAANQHRVEPGQVVKFEFVFSVPDGYAAGVYREHFTPVVEGVTVVSGSTPFLDVEVE